jgi:hypothetical protein
MTHELDRRSEAEKLREALKDRMKKAPAWINGASIQAVRKYKKDYAQAAKLVEKKGATAMELSAAISTLS